MLILEVLEICEEHNWEEKEIYWISQFNNLTNHKKGGNGNSDYVRVTKEETKKRLSDARKNVVLTEEWKNNIGKTLGFSCIIDGIEYRSIKQACIQLKLTHRIIKRRIASDEYPEYSFC